MLPLFILAHFGYHLITALPSPLSTYIRDEFKLDKKKTGLVTASYGFASGFGQLPAGWLADRIGQRNLIVISTMGVAAAGLFIGFSHTYVMLIICMVAMGLLAGGYHPSASPLISASVPENQRGRALGFHLVGGSLSFTVAPLIGAYIARTWTSMSWRGSFIALAIPTIILGIVFYIMLGRLSNIGRGRRGGAAKGVDEAPPPAGYKRRLIALMTLSILGGGMVGSAASFLPLYMVDTYEISNATAASLMFISSSAGLWVGPVGGSISDRIGRVPIILLSAFFTGTIILILRFVPYGWPFFAVLFLQGVISYLRMPVMEAFIMGQSPARWRSTVYGIYYFVMQETGAAFNPLMGWLIDTKGYPTSYTIAGAISMTMTVILSFFLWDGDKKQPAAGEVKAGA